MILVKRALLSCSDKTGLEVFAKELAALGVELIASSGTADCLRTHGLRVKTVEEFAGITEQLDGRVKTLHPKIHAGILARRDDPAHVQSVGREGLIDLVVVNLYPFQRTVQQAGVSLDQAVEQIDIGGVALLRAAAKNMAHVAVVSDPHQYSAVAQALHQGHGQLPDAMARTLAASAFESTSRYDACIHSFFSSTAGGDRGTTDEATTTLTLCKHQSLRYGENPHQQGAWYLPAAGAAWGIGTLRQLQGKELSYNNLLDIDAALRCLLDFSAPTCSIIKHNSQCGLASASTIETAYEQALACDTESAFGGMVGFNRPLTSGLAQRLTETFLEVVLAPSVDADALSRLGKKPNLRVVTLAWPATTPNDPEWRQLLGGWLRQDSDTLTVSPDDLRVATQRPPTDQERASLLFAWNAVKHVTSNGIVLVNATATVGIGQGQPSRVGAVRSAIEKAGKRSHHAVAASDGFFPFPDNVERLAQAGVTAVIQPGGSIRDQDVIAAADHAKMAMLFTGVRHFRH